MHHNNAQPETSTHSSMHAVLSCWHRFCGLVVKRPPGGRGRGGEWVGGGGSGGGEGDGNQASLSPVESYL